MESEPRKIFLVANAEQMFEQNADSLSRVAAGRVCACWVCNPSHPSLLHPISHSPTASKSPKNPRGSTRSLHTPRGSSPDLFVGAELQFSNIQLKTGNTPDTSADTEKQRGTFPEPCAGWEHIPDIRLVPALNIVSHENPAGHSKTF